VCHHYVWCVCPLRVVYHERVPQAAETGSGKTGAFGIPVVQLASEIRTRAMHGGGGGSAGAAGGALRSLSFFLSVVAPPSPPYPLRLFACCPVVHVGLNARVCWLRGPRCVVSERRLRSLWCWVWKRPVVVAGTRPLCVCCVVITVVICA
jgi:hypothetical protein